MLVGSEGKVNNKEMRLRETKKRVESINGKHVFTSTITVPRDFSFHFSMFELSPLARSGSEIYSGQRKRLA
jgi:hypothetical protein